MRPRIPPFRKNQKRERMGHPASQDSNGLEIPPFRKNQKRERMGHPASQDSNDLESHPFARVRARKDGAPTFHFIPEPRPEGHDPGEPAQVSNWYTNRATECPYNMSIDRHRGVQ